MAFYYFLGEGQFLCSRMSPSFLFPSPGWGQIFSKYKKVEYPKANEAAPNEIQVMDSPTPC